MTEFAAVNGDLSQAVSILQRGGIIIYPTETVYGFGCDPLNETACMRIQHLKERSASKTVLLLASDTAQVCSMVGTIPEHVSRIADRFWPGPLTLVFRPLKKVPDWLLGDSGGIAFRVTPDPVAAKLIHAYGKPIVSTSVNKSGQPSLSTAAEANNQFGEQVDLIINGGIRNGMPSTIIDVTDTDPVILREGGISKNDLNEVF